MKKRIVFYHLLNDYSGSPNVLALIIKGLVDRGYKIDLFTSSRNIGFLSGIEGVTYHNVFYEFTANRIRTFVLFLYAQFRFFFSAIRYSNKNTKIYINTILPFGATLGAALMNKRVIYHVHEIHLQQNLIRRISLYIFNQFSYKRIFVSKYLFENYNNVNKVNSFVYNAVSNDFRDIAVTHQINFKEPFTILMVCSLKVYKGVNIFIDMASKLSNYNFILILNAKDIEITNFFNETKLPDNLEINSTKTNLHPYYSRAHLVLNLSIPDQWVETFGLTALESMNYGIPVIVPPIGGIAEIIDEGVQGYKVDSRDQNLLINRIQQIFSSKQKYCEMSLNAKIKAEMFSYIKMIDRIEQIINE